MYQTTVYHTRRVLATTKGYPGARNDKTIARLDNALYMVRNKEPYKSMVFKPYYEDGMPGGKSTTHAGLYLIVDGGYRKVRWRVFFLLTTTFYLACSASSDVLVI